MPLRARVVLETGGRRRRGRVVVCGGPWQDDRVRFALRAASVADVDELLAIWQEAAGNDSRPPRIVAMEPVYRRPSAALALPTDALRNTMPPAGSSRDVA
jgi:hypothetical protein